MSLPLAEARALHGPSLDSQVRQACYGLAPEAVRALRARLVEESFRRSFIYVREGQAVAIPLLARPCVMLPEQLAYLHFVSLTLLNALKRLPDLYIQDFAIRALIPLTPPEEKWLWDYWGPSQREHNPVVGRLDAVIDFTSPMWKESLRFLEPNLSGVGGLHLTPTCEQMLLEVIWPYLGDVARRIRLEPGLDLRELFLHETRDHLEAIGRRGQTLCFIEPKYAGDGPVEQGPLADYYRDRHGLTVLHADPAELYLREGEVCYADQVVDVGYRDYEVRDLLALEVDEGLDTRPLRALFKQNRIISSLAGEFDHKSCFEVLTDPHFAHKYFSPAERQIFRRHVLWTRVLSDRCAALPNGEDGNLLEYVRRNQEELVLKPNRSYGGDRIVMGPTVSPGEWAAAIELAVQGEEHGDERVREPWVAQRLAQIPVNEFPVIAEDGTLSLEPFYTVMGFTPTRYGLSTLGRASQRQVVNVAQHGGICAVLMGEAVNGLGSG